MATLSKFSEDMMGNILSRLPPKSLMRFRCVLKSWHDLIDNPSFVDQHLSTSMDNKVTSSTYVLLKHNVLTDLSIKNDEKAIRATLFNYDSDQRDILLSSINPSSLADDGLEIENHAVPPPMRRHALSQEISGSCDGLICLNTSDSRTLFYAIQHSRNTEFFPSLAFFCLREFHVELKKMKTMIIMKKTTTTR
ncbi:S locus F-box protein with the low allelic sequence polymorphism 2-S4 [Prunus yedoensis var. nudiflora]|uniref:S locus F-box protein with the low allelic sequence polymorphism 2-S4 n=1 Tax=Prunus yedoensis var. nudiflora TaxID=2094558 RepID=A0A314ZNJ9_PRUYE|nr:S locus F-box protein with the low allelic sequence polymorphism 2-S4 [Prunus yedoensis var. nudiflora]